MIRSIIRRLTNAARRATPLALVAALPLPLAGPPSSRPPASSAVETVVAFDGAALELPESLAFDKRGNAYVSFAPTGEIRRVAPDLSQANVATLDPGLGFLLGLKVAPSGDIYAALASFTEGTHGVWRIDEDGSSELLAPLPLTSLPNDVALDRRGQVFVTDSLLGAVWRVSSGGDAEIWAQDELLVGQPHPDIPFPIGANGLAFGTDRALYVANTTFSRIVRIPIDPDGSPGDAEVLAEDADLGGPDGIAIDVLGNLYVTNALGGGVVRVDSDGGIEELVKDSEVDDPSSVAFGTARGHQRDLFITNFAFFTRENPALLKLRVGVPGLPLP